MTSLRTPLRLLRQSAPANPPTGFDAIYLDANGKVVQQDATGTKAVLNKGPLPQSWNAFGHSYLNFVSGTVWTTGRMDSQFRMALDVEFTNWRNFANISSKLAQDGRSQGGWVRVMQDITIAVPQGQNMHGAPYYPDNGAFLMCWGINDIGNIGGSATQTQIRSAFGNALRAVIARARCSVVWEDSYTGPAGQPSYGAGFTQTAGTSEFSSGTSLRDATSTTNATITLTLPSDYAGQPVVVQFVAEPGAAGGTVTFSGTAGVTGTLSTSNILPSATGYRVPVVRRITGLTSVNAGQTIVMAVTALDASGKVRFDYWGLESLTPVPVIVCNVARILSAGYALYANTIGDTDVANLNTTLTSVVAEFDQMVQIADIDSQLGKATANFASDGLHPNEIGAARAAQACFDAVMQLVPTDPKSATSNMNPSVPIAMGMRKCRFPNQYYTAEFAGTGTATAGVSGDLIAIPFFVTEGREVYSRIAINCAVAGSTASSIRWGVYEDIKLQGYPQTLWNEATSGGAFSLGTATGIKEASGIFWTLDPGLWWIVYKFTAIGTSQTFDIMTGPDGHCIMPRIGSTVSAGSTLAANSTPIAWGLTGQGTGALPNTFPAGATVRSSAHRVALFSALTKS